MTPQPPPEKPDPQAQFHTLPEDELFSVLGSSPNGLTSEQAQAGLLRFGNNDISHIRKVPVILQYLGHFKNLLIIILLIAAGISLFVGELTDAVIIFIIVFASVTLDFFQEYKAGEAADLLRQKILTRATVTPGRERTGPADHRARPGGSRQAHCRGHCPGRRPDTDRTDLLREPVLPHRRTIPGRKTAGRCRCRNPCHHGGKLHLPWHICCQRNGNGTRHKDRRIDRVWQSGKNPCRTPPGDGVRTGTPAVQLPDVEVRLLPRHHRLFHQCPVPARHPRIPALLHRTCSRHDTGTPAHDPVPEPVQGLDCDVKKGRHRETPGIDPEFREHGRALHGQDRDTHPERDRARTAPGHGRKRQRERPVLLVYQQHLRYRAKKSP